MSKSALLYRYTFVPPRGEQLAGSASLYGSGSLTTALLPFVAGAANMAGEGALVAAARPQILTGATLAGTGVLTAVNALAVANLLGYGSLTANGGAAAAAVAALAGAGGLAELDAAALSDSAAFFGSGALDAEGLALSSSAGFAATGTLTAAGAMGAVDAEGLSGSGSLTAAGVPGGVASLSGSGLLTGSGAAGVAGVTRSNRCEGGDGILVSTSNTGGPDQFDLVQTSGAGGGNLVFDATTVYKGTSSIRCTGGNTPQYVAWADGAKQQWYGRAYYQYQDAVPAVFPIVRFVSAGVNGANIRFGNSGKLTLHTGSTVGATGTVGTSKSIWYRVEFAVTFSATNGTMDAWLYEGDHATPLDHVTATGLALTDTADEVDFGLCNNNVPGFSLWIDDLNINTSAPPGPTA